MNKPKPNQHGVLFLMRVTCFHVLITVFSIAMANAAGSSAQAVLNRKVSVDVDGVEVQDVLKILGKQANVKFTYSPQRISVHDKVTLHGKAMKLSDALDLILSSNIEYQVVGEEQIALKPVADVNNSSDQAAQNYPGSAEVTVSGTIVDGTGNPLPGVSVILVGAGTGTSSDADGKFTITVPDENSVLKFSFIGFASQEVTVGTRTTIDIVLEEDISQLGEVVVTAFGIQKEQKRLGYSVTQVKGNEIQVTREPAFMNALTGKVAGVVVQSPNSGPGGSTRVLIRGNSTFSGSRQPLYVIDGVPIDNTYRSASGQPSETNAGNSSGIQTSDGLANLNPDDVESISVLKGVSAGALYGNRAQNGVILITTKKGRRDQGLGVTFNSNTVIESLVPYDDIQYTYGRGEGNQAYADVVNGYRAGQSWGARFGNTPTFIDFDGATRPYTPQKMSDNFKRFFRTGVSTTNSLAFAGGSEKSTYRLSLSNSYNSSPMPNVSYKRYNVAFRGTSELGKRLHADYKIDLSRTEKTQPLVGTDDRGSYGISFSRISNTTDIRTLNEKDAEGGFIYLYKNPYLAREKVFGKDNRDRIIASVDLRYDIAEYLNVVVKGGVDISDANTVFGIRPNNLWDQQGKMITNDQKIEEDNAIAMLNFNKTYGEFSVNITGGTSARYYKFASTNLEGNTFATPDLIDLSNMKVRQINPPGAQQKKVNSIFGSAQLGYGNYLFLELTGRQDWNSALAKKAAGTSQDGLFYPSANLSYVFTEHFSDAIPAFLSTGKIRASAGKVGSDQDPHQSDLSFTIMNTVNGVASAVITNNSLPPVKLKPEETTEIEFGTQLGFLENRLNIDFAWYSKKTKDFLLAAQVSSVNGYSSAFMNAGSMRNRGFELMISGTPVKKDNFSWDISLNMAQNRNLVLTLADEFAQTGVNFGNNIIAMEGRPFGGIYGTTYEKNAQGQDVYEGLDTNGDGTDDAVVRKRLNNNVYLGNGNAKVTGGLTNTFYYKRFSLSFLIDGQFGSSIYSTTNKWAKFFGLTTETLTGRDGEYVPNGVMTDGSPVTMPFSPFQQYNSGGSAAAAADESHVYKNDFIKLRQIALGYSIPSDLLSKTKLNAVSFQLIARNLFYFRKTAPMIDPNSSDSIGGGYGFESGALPASRTYGFNLNVQF